MTHGPNWGSRVRPAISSRLPDTMAWTSTPASLSSGRRCASSCPAWSRTSSDPRHVEADEVAFRLVGDPVAAELQSGGVAQLFGCAHRLVGGGDQALFGNGDAGVRQQLLRLVFGKRVCHGGVRVQGSIHDY